MRRATLTLLLVAAPGIASAAPAPWKPFDLGRHHRAVSTKVPGAQVAFDQGLNWAFAFNHDEAIRAFKEAVRLDPGLAMAHWGIALVNGPHINNPAVDEAHAKAAWDALQDARAQLAGASEVERALIEALGSRYAHPQPADRHPLDEAYAKAMAEVYRRFPQDADVATLYAEALMDVRPWDQWTRDGKPQPGTAEVLAALAAARQLNPDHPLALHLTIHALEASPRPGDAKEAADRLRALVPDASHLVHMPAHIDARIGQWQEAAAANERAMQADARYRERQPEIGFYALYMAHNVHFLAYAAMMEGRKEVALQKTRAVVDGFSPEFAKENAIWVDYFLTSHAEAMKRFGMWKEILEIPAPPAYLPYSIAHRHFLRAVAHGALGQLEAAAKEKAEFEAAAKKVPAEIVAGTNTATALLGVAEVYLDGELAYRRGDLKAAVDLLREAVKREDALKYDEPPDWTVPSRHALGAILLEAGRLAEAEAVYREDLVAYPENGWSLFGLQRALGRQGKTKEAAEVEARFQKIWARADIKLGASCLCVKAAP